MLRLTGTRVVASRSRRTITIAVVFAAMLIAASAHAQTFKVLHYFTGAADGANPNAGLTSDGVGGFYGTAAAGGANGYGTVYRLTIGGAGGFVSPIYAFADGDDGNGPASRVLLGPDLALYGTTIQGGGTLCENGNDDVVGCGTVYRIAVPHVCKTLVCPGTETVLYRFQGSTDGANPGNGDLAFDTAGNIYGTTLYGGPPISCLPPANGCGVVYQLTHFGNGWQENVIHSFAPPPDGYFPFAGVIFDSAGNLYGTTVQGGSGGGILPPGTVYRLAASNWTETILHSFPGDGSEGSDPVGGLLLDSAGNLYGTTVGGGPGSGTIYSLTKEGNGFQVLYTFPFQENGLGSYANLTMGSDGNLYGTTVANGLYGYGNVFKLSPSQNGWLYTSLHDFTDGDDGANPYSSVYIDPNGNLYGTTSLGGKTGTNCDPTNSNQCGVIWQITQ